MADCSNTDVSKNFLVIVLSCTNEHSKLGNFTENSRPFNLV